MALYTEKNLSAGPHMVGDIECINFKNCDHLLEINLILDKHWCNKRITECFIFQVYEEILI